MKRESVQIEYKEKYTDSFLKTVSAFANGHGGILLFGISDDKNRIGLSDPVKDALRIENKVNDSIDPRPDYEIKIDEEKKTVSLIVKEGLYKPYYYGNKAYTRSDSSSVEMGSNLLESLILKKKNLSYDDLQASEQELSFNTLDQELVKRLGLDIPGKDSYKSLGLLKNRSGYSVSALLLSDQNDYPGIDIVRYGEDINEIQYRRTIDHISILDAYHQAESIFDIFYRSEFIKGKAREVHYRIPVNAYREALLNALIHRDWSRRDTTIIIRMFDNRLEITSPGGLPEGISEQEYLNDILSVPRNPNLAYVFLRLGYIERLGSGIQRIISSYTQLPATPKFRFTENSITAVLPVIPRSADLDPDQQIVYSLIGNRGPLSRAGIQKDTGFGRNKLSRLLNQLIDMGLICKIGAGKSTKYAVKKLLAAD